MGSPKAHLRVDGEPLLSRQLRLLHETGAAELIVAQHPDRPEPLAAPLSAEVVFDSPPDAGPLAGVSAALARCRHPLLLVVAVDLPGLTREFLTRLWEQSSPTQGVIPVLRGRLEPLAAMYPKSAGEVCQQQLRSGRFAVHEWAELGLTEGWLKRWELEPIWHPCLLNWNEPGDFVGSR
ncbi:MAG: molybdenum cofactor guanylyltransferase [Verrucomicrobia bacterium]|nr:molybdenum cofactor guanylyltransferase [Verrucomicrobiota bacterium]